MSKQTRKATYNGIPYEVDTDEAKKNEMLLSYAQVYRIRKDGTRGRKIYDPDHLRDP